MLKSPDSRASCNVSNKDPLIQADSGATCLLCTVTRCATKFNRKYGSHVSLSCMSVWWTYPFTKMLWLQDVTSVCRPSYLVFQHTPAVRLIILLLEMEIVVEVHVVLDLEFSAVGYHNTTANCEKDQQLPASDAATT